MSPASDHTGLADVDARLRELVDAYGTFLRAAVRGLYRSPLAAGRIEQDARIRLWRALRRRKHVAHSASSFQKMAATAAIDAARRVRTRRDLPIEWPTAGALRRLPDNRRRAVGLHLQGFTSTEIGDLLGWSEPKARNLAHRGRKELRALLQRDGVDLPGHQI